MLPVPLLFVPAPAAAAAFNQGFADAVVSLQDGGFRIAATLIPVLSAYGSGGVGVYGGLSAVMLAWIGINMLLRRSDPDPVIRQLVMFVLLWGIGAWLLDGERYEYILGDFLGGFDALGFVIMNGAWPSSLEQGSSSFPLILNESLNQFARITAQFNELSAALHEQGEYIALALAFLARMVMYLAFALLQVSFALILFISGVGIAIGPMLIVFVIFQPLSYLFDGWFRLMVWAGVMRVVAAAVLKVSSAVFEGAAEHARRLLAGGELSDFPLATALVVLVYAFVVVVGVQKVPYLAELILDGRGIALLPGASGGGRGGAGRGRGVVRRLSGAARASPRPRPR